jgi:hypothetical protein
LKKEIRRIKIVGRAKREINLVISIVQGSDVAAVIAGVRFIAGDDGDGS